MFRKPMKMRNLEAWGIPSYMVDILEENYSSDLLKVQEEAVRYYGVLDFDGSTGLPRRFAPRNDKKCVCNDRKDLLVVAPTSSGKTFIGEMAAITQAINQKKTIYLVPLRSLAEEKYRHFKKLYGGADCKISILVSSRDRREDDRKIIKGEYQVAVMVYEKFNYFLLKYPQLLKDVSLIIIDELQMIHDPVRGPLLERIIESIRKSKAAIKFIGLSAYLENEVGFLSWFPASHLLSYERPVELRKGIMRGGIFRYVTHNKCEYGEEEFFKVEEGQDTPYEDCLKDTISYFIKKGEPTLLFFSTKKETRKWAGWLAGQIDAPRAKAAICELSRMEETRSRDELLYLLEKGLAYHNADLSWEERNIVETYLRAGEIKIICATTTLAMGINLPFKNVILSGDKYVSGNGDYKSSYRTSLSLADVENMGGRAGRLNWKKREFGRVIFLADSLFAETVLQNVYFKLMKEDKKKQKKMVGVGENGELYGKSVTERERKKERKRENAGQVYRPVKKEKDFITFLLRAIVDGEDSKDKLKNYLRGVTPNFEGNGSYWVFDFEKNGKSKGMGEGKDEGDLEEEIDLAVEELVEHHLITKDKTLSATKEGVLLCARGIGIETYLYFKEYLEKKKGKMSHLEIITLLAFSEEGKRFYIPFPQFNHRANRYNWNDWKGQYYRRMRHLVLEAGEEYKEVYQDIFDFEDEENNSLDLNAGNRGNTEDSGKAENAENFLSIKKAVFLYDWIGEKEIRELEEGYKFYGGSIQKLGEGFSWLADALGGVGEILGWDGNKEKPVSGNGKSVPGMLREKDEIKKDNLGKIKVLSERLAWGVEEKGLELARLHIPGLGRSYIRVLLREGYDNKKCLEELAEEELGKVVPKRLAGRIKNRYPTVLSSSFTKNDKPKTKNLLLESCNLKPEIRNLQPESCNSQLASSLSSPPPCRGRIKVGVSLNTNDQRLTTVLEIDQHRPDRIIFEGKEVKVTTIGFSLICLLAQHRGEVVSYEEILKKLWGVETEATYTRIIQHIYKFRKDILDVIGNSKTNKEKIKDTFRVVSGRGVMLNINGMEIKVN